MSSSQPATDLREAYRVCEPKPLNGEDFDLYYEPLLGEDDFDAVKAIGASLFVQEPSEHKTFFVAGHRGCGKTTELNLLVKNWCEDYHVIYIEVDKLLNLNNIDYIDIYLLAAFYLNQHIGKHEVSIEPNIIKQFEDVLIRIVDCVTGYSDEEFNEEISSLSSIMEKEDSRRLELSTGFASLLNGILLKINGSETTGRLNLSSNLEALNCENVATYRKAFVDFEDQFKNIFEVLLNDFNKVLKKQKNSYKGLLIIFDNLDKCDPDTAKVIFQNEIERLFEIKCNVIYTVPIFNLNYLEETYKNIFLIPLLNIYQFSESESQPPTNSLTIQKIINLLNRRVDTNILFDSDKIIHKLIISSGGNLRNLFMILQRSYISAIGRGNKTVNEVDVNYSIEQFQNIFERSISSESYYDIAESFYTKTLQSDSAALALYGGLISQYHYKKRDWFFPNPIILQIDKFKKALREVKKSSTEISEAKKSDYSWRNLVISEIELHNIRCFEDLHISFSENENPSDWIMILGENAAGKTTLLRSIALGLCDQSDAAALMSSMRGDLVREGTDEGYIKIVLCNKDASQLPLLRSQQLHRALLSAFPTISKLKALKNALPEELGQPSHYPNLSEQIVEMIENAKKEEKLDELIEIARQQSPENPSLQNLDEIDKTNTYTITTTITKQAENNEILTQRIEPNIDFLWSDIFVCGYGANRTTLTYTNHEGYRSLDSVQSLFNPTASFQDPEVVLRRRTDEMRKQIEQQLLKVLMLDDHAEYQFHYSDRGIEVDGPWGRQPLASLSDGYRSTSQWLLDFIGWAVHANRLTESGNIGGILLIDEVEQHLHPNWQRYLVQRLHEIFPNTQIIASTHTPLAASGVADIDSGVLIKLDRSPENGVQAKLIDKKELYGKRADQVLTSEAFGLFTSRNEGSLTDIDRYSELLGLSERTEDEENELQELRGIVRESLQDGENPTERLIRSEVESAIEKVVNDITPELLELEITKHLQQLANQEV